MYLLLTHLNLFRNVYLVSSIFQVLVTKHQFLSSQCIFSCSSSKTLKIDIQLKLDSLPKTYIALFHILFFSPFISTPLQSSHNKEYQPCLVILHHPSLTGLNMLQIWDKEGTKRLLSAHIYAKSQHSIGKIAEVVFKIHWSDIWGEKNHRASSPTQSLHNCSILLKPREMLKSQDNDKKRGGLCNQKMLHFSF